VLAKNGKSPRKGFTYMYNGFYFRNKTTAAFERAEFCIVKKKGTD
jgi:hypothetical protein